MTVYYMHVRDGARLVCDLEGADYSDDLAALQAARQIARDLLAKMEQREVESLGKRIEIETSEGREVARVAFWDQVGDVDDPVDGVILGGFSETADAHFREESASDQRRRERVLQR